MIFFILIVGACSYFVWKRVENLKYDYLPINKKRLLYFPIAQFISCLLWCIIALAFNGDLPKDEINQFIEEYGFVSDLSSALLGLDLTSDQISMYMIVRSLHNKAIFVFIGSILMMLIQIIGSYNKRLDKLVVEGVSGIHTFCSFYICYFVIEAFMFMINQMGMMKLLNAISASNSSPINKDNLFIWALPTCLATFHYLYHFVLEKYYTNEK